MIFALLLLAQEVPPPADAEEEVVITAVYGRTTLLFDKGSDGKLYNCRIMISSGSARLDKDACHATPVCYAGTADEVTDCVPYVSVEAGDITRKVSAPGARTSDAFAMPQLVKLPVAPVVVIGPVQLTQESRESERQRVKLPELPKPSSDGPAIRITTGQSEDSRPGDSRVLPGRAD